MAGALERRILQAGHDLPQRRAGGPLVLVHGSPDRLNEVKGCRPLVEGEGRILSDPLSGAIYLSSWHALTGEGQPKDETIIFQRGKKPQNGQVHRWSKFPNIENAIRSVGHVLEGHGRNKGTVVEENLGVARFISKSLAQFRGGQITAENLEEMAQQALVKLNEAGFVTAKKPNKQEIAKKIQKALGKDSLSRVNPLVSRSRLLSAWLRVTGELLFDRRVWEKYSSLWVSLNVERDLERAYFDQAQIRLEDLSKSSAANPEVEAKINILLNFAAKHLSPEVIKAAPYRKAAALSMAYLFGVRKPENQALIRNMLKENPQQAENLINFKPLNIVLREGKDRTEAFGEVKARLKKALRLINGALTAGQKILETKEYCCPDCEPR